MELMRIVPREQSSNKLKDDLCLACQPWLNDWDTRSDSKSTFKDPEHHNILDLKSCPCGACRIFLGTFDAATIHQMESTCPNHRSELLRLENWRPYGAYQSLRLNFKSIKGGFPGACSWWISVYPASPAAVPRVEATQSETDCDATWQLVEKCLGTCRGSHCDCAKPLMETQKPTRLIAVGALDESPRVVLSRNLQSDTQYVTLSHCWGRKTFTTLTKDNLPEFLIRIPSSALTKTFREAIYTTRKLGFKYLWIDSLCIVQDDDKDWRHEAALMGYVYSNSSLNLAAADAPDGDTGLFFEREPESVAWVTAFPKDSAPSENEVLTCTLEDLSKYALDNCTLSTRAWTYQERFLSPRTLHFGRAQLVWECRTIITHELFPEGLMEDYTPMAKLGCSIMKHEDFEDQVKLWERVIQDYTVRNLTFGRDKLVGLSGIARLVGPHFGSRYLAGLWEKGLPTQLLWWVSDITKSWNSNGAQYQAPSWSWASTNNECHAMSFWHPPSNLFVKDIEATITVVDGQDEFGEVVDGCIRLRALALPQGTIDTASRNGYLYSYVYGGRISSYVRGLRFLVYPDRSLSEVEGILYFLPVLTLSNDGLWGIILKKTSNGDFCRKAAFRINLDDNPGEKELWNFLAAGMVSSNQGEAGPIVANWDAAEIINIV